jgi:hypothetical protein
MPLLRLMMNFGGLMKITGRNWLMFNGCTGVSDVKAYQVVKFCEREKFME